MKKVFLLSMLVASVALPLTDPAPASAQMLQRVSQAARGRRASSARSASRRRATRHRHPRRSASDTDTLEALLFPFLGPVFATGDRWGPGWWLADHPYADRVSGYAVYLPEDMADATSPPVQDLAMFVSAEGGYLTGRASRSALELRVMLPERLEIDTSATVLTEPQSDGRWSAVGMETVHLGLRFAQDTTWQFHVGLGARLFHDRWGALPGFDFRYSVDVFVVRPLVVSARVSLGNLDRALTLGGRLTVGALVGPVELFVGYDHFSILDLEESANGASVSGPVGGLRVWI